MLSCSQALFRPIVRSAFRSGTIMPKSVKSPLLIQAGRTFSQSTRASNYGSNHRVLFGSITAVATAASIAFIKFETLHAENSKSGPLWSTDQLTVVFVIGSPGAGKSTISWNVTDRFNFVHLHDEHDLFDEINRLAEDPEHQRSKLRVLIDGFPRTLYEAIWFEEEVCPAAYCIFIDCPVGAAASRMPDDQSARIIELGHKLFAQESLAVVEYYRKSGRLIEVSGEHETDIVWQEVEQKLGAALNSEKKLGGLLSWLF